MAGEGERDGRKACTVTTCSQSSVRREPVFDKMGIACLRSEREERLRRAAILCFLRNVRCEVVEVEVVQMLLVSPNALFGLPSVWGLVWSSIALVVWSLSCIIISSVRNGFNSGSTSCAGQGSASVEFQKRGRTYVIVATMSAVE